MHALVLPCRRVASYGSPEKLVGTVLDGTYQIERLVGEGAFGEVYAAKHLRLGRPVAVKVLRAIDPDAFARFRREAEITSSLGSRYIAQVFDFNTMPGGEPYLVMELLEGEDLATRLARVKTIAVAQALKICEQVASALAVAHKHQIVHRDLKPQNIFLCRSDDEGELVKVIDFGISKVMSSASSTAVGQFLGSPLYMSPEQVRGRNDEIDERTDVYALGAVIFEALAGRPPFQASSVFELVEKIGGEAPPKVSAVRPGDGELPPAVDEVLTRAMAKRREDRPKSVTELYNQLANAIRSPSRAEASTPAAAIVGTHALETMHITGAVATPLWRGRTSAEDQLRFVAPEGGFYPNDFRSRTLKIMPDRHEYFIGSVPKIESITNDCVLPHRQVSRNAARVVVRDGRVWLRREPRCNVPVRVGLLLLERDEERPLHHGQPIAIGVVAGVFHDGRYVPSQAPALAVDEQTGLLGREGLAWEIALAARLGDARRVLLAMPVGEADEAVACKAALALHAGWPVWPVARFRGFAAALVPGDGDVVAAAAAMRAAASVPLAIGVLPAGTSGDQAGARIDEAIGALSRLAAASGGTPPGEVVDLAQHALRLVALAPFAREAEQAIARGGEVGLVVMDDLDQLRGFGETVVAALELELLQVTGRIAGGAAVLTRAAPGAVAFAGPDAAEPITRQVAAEWHSRGAVRGEVVEVERGLSTAVVSGADLRQLPRLAHELVTGGGLGAGVDTLPLPIAARVREAMTATSAPARAEALVEVVTATWKLLGISLASMALAGRAKGEPFDLAIAAGLSAPGAAVIPVTGSIPATTPAVFVIGPWRQVAANAAATLAGAHGRVGELVGALFDGGAPRPALAAATDEAVAIAGASSAASLPRGVDKLERAVADLLAALRPLRGWTLVHVDRVDRVDVFGDCETVHYVDYTGTYERGTPRQVTLVKDLRMGPFAYLARLAEGIVVPLEPHLRQRLDPVTGAPGLYWADAPITHPGDHTFSHVLTGATLADEVTAKQIPRSRR